MIAKISVKKIVYDHLDTLKDHGSKKDFSVKDYVGFIIIPFSLSLIATYFGLRLTDIDTVLLTSFSIFAGLLFNLLVLVQGMITGRKTKPKDVKRKNIQLQAFDVMHELFTNVSFSILVALLTIIFVLFSFISCNNIYQIILNIITLTLVGNFIFTLLMILKRTHSVLSFQSKTHKQFYSDEYKDMN